MNATLTSFNSLGARQKIIREISHELKVASAAKVWIAARPGSRGRAAGAVAEKPFENKRFHPLPLGSMVAASRPSLSGRSTGGIALSVDTEVGAKARRPFSTRN